MELKEILLRVHRLNDQPATTGILRSNVVRHLGLHGLRRNDSLLVMVLGGEGR